MVLLFIGSTIRTILIVIAVFVIVRFFGRVMTAKRDLDNDKQFRDKQSDFKREKQRVLQDEGKVHIVEDVRQEAEDADYEEVKKKE